MSSVLLHTDRKTEEGNLPGVGAAIMSMNITVIKTYRYTLLEPGRTVRHFIMSLC